MRSRMSRFNFATWENKFGQSLNVSFRQIVRDIAAARCCSTDSNYSRAIHSCSESVSLSHMKTSQVLRYVRLTLLRYSSEVLFPFEGLTVELVIVAVDPGGFEPPFSKKENPANGDGLAAEKRDECPQEQVLSHFLSGEDYSITGHHASFEKGVKLEAAVDTPETGDPF